MRVAVGSPLFLPEWDGLLDAVDRFSTCGKCFVAMRGAGRDTDRNIAYGKAPNAVHGRDATARVLGSHTR